MMWGGAGDSKTDDLNEKKINTRNYLSRKIFCVSYIVSDYEYREYHDSSQRGAQKYYNYWT